jgi:hypothetical protein
MIKKTFHFSFKVFMEILFMVFLLWIATIIGIASVLKHGSYDLANIVPIIEGKINQSMDDNNVSIETMAIEWNGLTTPINVIANNVSVRNERGAFLHTPQLSISVSPAPLVIGRLAIKDMVVSRIILSLTRTMDGQMQITGRNRGVQNTENKPIPAVLTLNDLIYDLPSLESLSVTDAQIIYIDEIDQDVQHFDPVNIFINMDKTRGDRQLNGYVSLPFGDVYSGSIIRLNFQTQNEPLALNVQANIKDVPVDSFLKFAPPLPEGWDFNMIVNSDIQAQVDNLWNVNAFNFLLEAPRGQVIAQYGGNEHLFEISNLSSKISNPVGSDSVVVEEFKVILNDGSDIGLSGQFDSIQNLDELKGAFKLNVSKLPQSMLGRYWPKTAQENAAYTWLVERMSAGNFKDIELDMEFNRTWTERADDIKLPPWLKTVNASYAFENMTVDYRAPLTAATKINGSGTYDGAVIDIDIDNADVGGLGVRQADLSFTMGKQDEPGNAVMSFPFTSGLKAVFDYIAKDPINALDKIEFDTKTATGKVDGKVDINFPLRKNLPAEEINVDVTGDLTDINIKNIVKNLTLTGGPFTIKTGTKQIELTGFGQLDGMPTELQYSQYFKPANTADYKTKIKVKTSANAPIRKAFIGDFSDYVDGPVGVDMNYQVDRTGVDTTIDLSLKMADASLNIAAIGLVKAKGEPLPATMKINLKNGQMTSIRNVKISGQTVRVENGDVVFRQLNGESIVQSARFKSTKFGDNNLSIEANDKNGVLFIGMTGSSFDARPILEGKKKEQEKVTKTASRPFNVSINVDDMRTSDTSTLKNAKINLASNSNGKVDMFELDAVAGAGNLLVRYTPQTPDENGLSLRVESNNAGDTLRAFGLYQNMFGGTLRIGGKPLEGGSLGDVAGKVRIDKFKVTNTPILVRLLNALSFKEPSNSLDFERLESAFEWRLGDNGNIYRITDGTTKGASIGLTFDGVVDTGKGTMNIKGTAAPLSQINNFVGNIPLIGDILTGGGGALLAATYSVSGDTKAPNVSVNPLSVLTPGIIRKILFEGAPTKAPEPKASPDNDKKERPLN